MCVVAILQARTSSSRLPNKVLLPILGIPMLAHQILRVKETQRIDKLIVATSSEESDDAIAQLCKVAGVYCYRGSLQDVLDRYYQAALTIKATHVVRLTGDCPLTDPSVIDGVIEHHLDTKADYTSNCLPPTFPDGLDAEIMTFTALESAWQNAKLLSEREHVTSYIRREDVGYHLENYANEVDLSSMRWTVDEPEDFEFVTQIYSELYPQNRFFSKDTILDLLRKKPQLQTINSCFIRNEGYEKSLINNKEIN